MGTKVEIKNINNDIRNYDANANAKLNKIESIEEESNVVIAVKNIQKFDDQSKKK
jgi:hypothetical protein